MKKVLWLLVLATIVSCRGPKGETGPQGLTGLPGPSGAPETGVITTYNGAVTSDNQSIATPAYAPTSVVVVYVTLSGKTVQLPIYNITKSLNVLYTTDTGIITLFNAQTGGADTYKIMVIN